MEVMNILKKLKQHAEQTPDKIILVSDLQDKGVTFSELEELSGRVLAYLIKKGIKKEDFVAIKLPRGADPLICAAGVVKSGAAFVIIEEIYPKERVAFIENNCNSKLTIDRAVWQEILCEQPSHDIAPWDDNAACCAVYTSGSTGVPKGVVHEYGNVKYMILTGDNDITAATPDDRMAIISPLSFIPSIVVFFASVYVGMRYLIVPYPVVKNPMELGQYLLDSGATATFFPQALLKIFPKFGPKMRLIFASGEVISQVYREDIQILNCYNASEFGINVCCFDIDKPYDITPVGTVQFGLEVFLLDEAKNPVPDGEVGEFCIHLPFNRGYLNRPEENEKAFSQGRIFHTGDLASKQADGNYVIHGRINDMIKINGNRVEPDEVAAVVKKALKLNWAAAKGFSNGTSNYLCLYYIQDIEIDYDQAITELKKHLPSYMLPAHFIKLATVPINPHGKLDRLSLKPPILADYLSEYVAPTNDAEAQLCAAFAQALQLDKVGINDDFQLLGGDSLGAMVVLTHCNIAGLTIGEIVQGRTPAKIALLCAQNTSTLSAQDEKNTLGATYPLSTEQLFMMDYQLSAPKSTMYNLPILIKLGAGLDIIKFCDAINQTINRHPALLTVFNFDAESEVSQHYDATLAKAVTVENISESEFATLKDELVQPFKMVDSLMFRCRIFKTEVASYLFFDVHHTVFDGTSFGVLFYDINTIYGNNLRLLKDDPYYLMLAQNEKVKQTAAYQEKLDYFTNNYNNKTFEMLKPHANNTNENRFDTLEVLLPKIDNQPICSASTKSMPSNNVLFLSISALALAHYCKKPYAEFTWVYNGRDSAKRMSAVGLLYNILPICVNLPNNRKLAEIIEDVSEQVMHGILHSDAHFISGKMRSNNDYGVCMIYQDRMRDFDTLCSEKFEIVPVQAHNLASQSALDIEIMQTDDGTLVKFNFNSAMFDKSVMQKLITSFKQISLTLLENAAFVDLSVQEIMHACTSPQ